jgi:hypothetical protein
MKLRRFASVLAVLALMGVWMNRSVVVTHADNTLSLATPSLTYTHGPFVYPNVTDQVGPPNCSVPQSCDDYPLTVSVPAGTDATKQINICFSYDQSTDPEVDFDIWVYDSKGNVIASNVNPTPPNECVTIAAVSGSYTVRADPWFPGGESYTGHIDLVASPIASSKPAAGCRHQGDRDRSPLPGFPGSHEPRREHRRRALDRRRFEDRRRHDQLGPADTEGSFRRQLLPGESHLVRHQRLHLQGQPRSHSLHGPEHRTDLGFAADRPGQPHLVQRR